MSITPPDQKARNLRIAKVCDTIMADMENDAREFDGKPFTGKTVAQYLGNQGAAIAALAHLIKKVINE